MKLPRSAKKQHLLFESGRESVSAWVNRLPRANLSETGKQLYRALEELSGLDCTFRQRLEILEALRPSVNLVLRGLRNNYLNTSIVLPEKATAFVHFCNALNQQLVDNYRQVSSAILERSWVGRYKSSLALSLHRELSEHSQLLLRQYNLYQGEDKTFWERIHACYRIAHRYRLTGTRITDNDHGHCTLEQAYLRPMLFVGANPYQLTQQFQTQLHENLHQLAEHTRIHETDPRKYCFMFDPSGTQPLVYQELCENAEGLLGLDTSALVEHITRQLNNDGDSETALPSALCRKLLRVWSSISDRIEQRNIDTQKLELAAGLASTHFYVGKEQALEDFTRGLEADIVHYNNGESLSTLLEEHIPHQQIGPEEYSVEFVSYSNSQHDITDEKSRSYRHFWVNTVNSSGNGYCISWPTSESNVLLNGDVICVREADAPCWSVGSIGWVKRHTEEELRAGIMILSHAAEAYVARPVGSGYVYRALLLCAERVSGKSEGLLLPNVSLPPQTELELTQPGRRKRVHIGKLLQKTRHFALYSYDLDKQQNGSAEENKGKILEEAWDSI
ncbi:hypothetical protein FHR99_000296 [Litorivivens lipolytica]|uniref:GTPase n=1 Tax=Litorivivens lipolytica TaxID=1524264 RepID=A0A7W4W258_9GAMM|nr:hypothetical protein [Litorivivens lipolytica]MBB3046060.1 hypothetical protein [Litorivivens lipolytica]